MSNKIKLKYNSSEYVDKGKVAFRDIDITKTWAESMGYIANDFPNQIDNIFFGKNGFATNFDFDENSKAIINNKIKDIKQFSSLISEFFFRQVEYIENSENNSTELPDSAPATCKKPLLLWLYMI